MFDRVLNTPLISLEDKHIITVSFLKFIKLAFIGEKLSDTPFYYKLRQLSCDTFKKSFALLGIIHLVRTFVFWKTDISYHLIKKYAYILSKWSFTEWKYRIFMTLVVHKYFST